MTFKHNVNTLLDKAEISIHKAAELSMTTGRTILFYCLFVCLDFFIFFFLKEGKREFVQLTLH